MRWKQSVKIIEKSDMLMLCLGEESCPVQHDDIYLVKAIAQGVQDVEQLKLLIMEYDRSNEIMAEMTLAQFLLKYQPFLEKDTSYCQIFV